MEKEIGRWTQADGTIRVHLESPLGGDFGMKQSFKTLGPDGLPLEQEVTPEPSSTEAPAGIAELTPGQVILEIVSMQADEGTLRVDS